MIVNKAQQATRFSGSGRRFFHLLFNKGLIVINSSYFDRTNLASRRIGKTILEDTDTFAQYCGKYCALDSYIALLCVSAFNQLPNLPRLQTFYVVFVKKESPLSINASDAEFASIVRLATVGPTYKPNSRNIDVAKAPPQTALNSMMDPICTTLDDTHSRYKILSDRQGSRINRLLHIPTKTRKVFEQQKPISNQDVIDGLKILESGGWPVRYMSLSKIVIGF